MKEELQSILDHWDYDKALAWFCEHVKGKFFVKEMLKEAKDSFNTLKLKTELNEALKEIQSREEPPPPPSQAPKEETDSSPARSVVGQAPQTMQELHLDEEWKPIYKEAKYYHSRIHESQSDEERKELAFKVLDMMDEVEKLWDQKRFVQRHGVMPEYPFQGLESLSDLDLSKRRNTLRTYISKAKKGKLNAEKIPEWESEMQEIERRLRG